MLSTQLASCSLFHWENIERMPITFYTFWKSKYIIATYATWNDHQRQANDKADWSRRWQWSEWTIVSLQRAREQEQRGEQSKPTWYFRILISSFFRFNGQTQSFAILENHSASHRSRQQAEDHIHEQGADRRILRKDVQRAKSAANGRAQSESVSAEGDRSSHYLSDAHDPRDWGWQAIVVFCCCRCLMRLF